MNKRAEETTPTSTIVTIVIVSLVIVSVFALIIRAEIVQKFKDLPGGEEEQEVTVPPEVAPGCDFEAGKIVTSDKSHIYIAGKRTALYFENRDLYLDRPLRTDPKIGELQGSMLKLKCDVFNKNSGFYKDYKSYFDAIGNYNFKQLHGAAQYSLTLCRVAPDKKPESEIPGGCLQTA